MRCADKKGQDAFKLVRLADSHESAYAAYVGSYGGRDTLTIVDKQNKLLKHAIVALS